MGLKKGKKKRFELWFTDRITGRWDPHCLPCGVLTGWLAGWLAGWCPAAVLCERGGEGVEDTHAGSADLAPGSCSALLGLYGSEALWLCGQTTANGNQPLLPATCARGAVPVKMNFTAGSTHWTKLLLHLLRFATGGVVTKTRKFHELWWLTRFVLNFHQGNFSPSVVRAVVGSRWQQKTVHVHTRVQMESFSDQLFRTLESVTDFLMPVCHVPLCPPQGRMQLAGTTVTKQLEDADNGLFAFDITGL